MRPFLVGGVLLAVAGAAPLQTASAQDLRTQELLSQQLLAQGLYTDPGRLNGLQMQVEQQQRDALASQQAAAAAQARLETEQRIASLNAQRAGQAALAAPPASPARDNAILQSAIDRAKALDAQVGADADRLSQLTAQSLANGNARIVAVKPALR